MFIFSRSNFSPALLAGMLAFGSMAFGQADGLSAQVDWTNTTKQVNRPIFSLQGFMQVYSQPDPMVMDTFKLLNPKGTQTRLETYIHQMEPENDNDDPNVFNWDKLYDDKMIRFIDDRAAFEEVYWDELGMIPLSLLCYNVDWNVSDNPDDPIKSKEEWTEFAAAVVQSYNGIGEEYQPRMTLAQVWNEPNMDMFYTGTPESYYELFNMVAERIHRDYPGVLVGGPTITPAGSDFDAFMDGFFEHCGENVDYVIFHHYGPKGEGHQILLDKVEKLAKTLRAIPGKEDGKVMITETDAWFQGWDKIQFILNRQFGFLGQSDLISGIHHFCAMAYNESGNYTFGTVDEKGGVIDGIFWPYWLFRNYIGEVVPVALGEMSDEVFQVVASADETGNSAVYTFVAHNKTAARQKLNTTFTFPPSENDRILTINSVSENYKGIKDVALVPALSKSLDLELDFAAREALSVNLANRGRRHFAFADLNNQEEPWIGLETSATDISVGQKATFDVEILNTTTDPVSGLINVMGVPDGWQIRMSEDDAILQDLAFGERREFEIELTASNVIADEQVGIYVTLTREGQEKYSVNSIPETLKFIPPYEITVLPNPIYAVPGDNATLYVQACRQTEDAPDISATISVPFASASIKASGTQTIAGDCSRSAFPMTIPEDLSDAVEGTATLAMGPATLDAGFRIVRTSPFTTHEKQQPVDLSDHLNFDPYCFWEDREDTDDMGIFKFPADYLPSDTVATSRGVQFLMPDISDDAKGAVLAKGQTIEVPAGKYAEVIFLGWGHDGKHPGAFTFIYADGSEQSIDSEVPEWCTSPDFAVEAFAAPHRYTPGGISGPPCQLWMWKLELDATKELGSIKLPSFDRAGYIHAITLAGD